MSGPMLKFFGGEDTRQDVATGKAVRGGRERGAVRTHTFSLAGSHTVNTQTDFTPLAPYISSVSVGDATIREFSRGSVTIETTVDNATVTFFIV